MIPADVLANAKARLDVPGVWRAISLPGEPRPSCRCPNHDDGSASLSIFDDGRAWKCHAGCGQGDAVEFLAVARRLSKGDALREFVRLAGLSPEPTKASSARLVRIASARPWPAMDTGTPAQHGQLAALRHLAPEAVTLAVARGLVAFGVWRGQPAWFLRDDSNRVAQARRMDGLKWNADGPTALTLPGGCASWPVGVLAAQNFPLVAMSEGGPDLLAVLHFALVEGGAGNVAPVAMLGASNAIHADALPAFVGRRVRLFPHADDAGKSAAFRWAQQLTDAGAAVEVFILPEVRTVAGERCKDVNDLTRLDADGFELHRELWNLTTI